MEEFKKVGRKSEIRWIYEIKSRRGGLSFDWKEIYSFRDLLFLFVRRDIVSMYKQTILGPLWFIIQPILTSLTQFIVFGEIASIPSDGVPYFLFVLAGNTLWNYFSLSFTGVADTFKTNEGIFGKVYFPRAIMPIAITISNLFKFSIQFILFVIVLIYSISVGVIIHPNVYILFTPIIIFFMALISMGCGMLITSLTTKYRDFTFLLGFGINMLMYVTPVVYPTSLVLSKVSTQLQWLIYLNPLTGLFDLFKYGYFGEGVLCWGGIIWSFLFSVVIYLFGLAVFNKTEKTFMDTI